MDLTLHFPDSETCKQFARWWALHGKETCLRFVERTVAQAPAEYLHVQEAEGEPERWEFWWDDVPF